MLWKAIKMVREWQWMGTWERTFWSIAILSAMLPLPLGFIYAMACGQYIENIPFRLVCAGTGCMGIILASQNIGMHCITLLNKIEADRDKKKQP